MKKLTGLILFLGLSQAANALLIDNGTYTTDDTAGLDWLDITETLNVAYVDALNGRTGWRYATAGEVGNLFQEFFPSYSPTNVIYDYSTFTYQLGEEVQYAQAEYFSSLLGGYISYIQGSTVLQSYGMYTRDNNPTLYMAGANLLGNSTSLVYGLNHEVSFQSAMSNGYDIYGTYLVRNTTSVPEPAPLALMGIGLLGLYVSRRRNKRQMV